MTCHCGNCEDHRVDSWKMFDYDSVQWTEATLDEVKEEIFGTPTQHKVKKIMEEDKKQISIEVLVSGGITTVQVFHVGRMIYHLQTGVGANEMAFLFQDYVIPLRNMLEALGFETTEIVKNV